MLPLLVLQAAADDGLRDQDRRLLLLLHRHLDYYEYRPLKLIVVRSLLRSNRGNICDKGSASRSLRNLVRLGYLDRSPRASFTDRVQCYRLRFERAQLHSVPTTPAA